MAPKNNYHPEGTQDYKFDKNLDANVRAQYQPIFNTDGQPVVMEGAFNARRDAQMKRRKAQGK